MFVDLYFDPGYLLINFTRISEGFRTESRRDLTVTHREAYRLYVGSHTPVHSRDAEVAQVAALLAFVETCLRPILLILALLAAEEW